MAGGPNVYTFCLEQCQGALFRAHYVDGFSLVEFTEGMDCVFDAIRSITFIKIKVGLTQWQYRKKKWDKIWDIKNGGPSPDVRRELLNQRSWFSKGVDGSLALEPFNLDSFTLSTLPAGLRNAVDTNTSHDMAMGEHGFSSTSKVGHSHEPSLEAGGSDLQPSNHSTALQNLWQAQLSYTPEIPLEIDHFLSNMVTPVACQASLVDSIATYPNRFFGPQQPSPMASQQGSLTTEALATTQLNPSFFSSGHYSDLPHAFTNPEGGGNSRASSDNIGYIDPLTRNPVSLGAQSQRSPGNTWPTTSQPIRHETTSLGALSIPESSPHTEQQ